MAEIPGVAGGGDGEILGLGGAGGRGAGDRGVGARAGRVEGGAVGAGRVALQPGELAACVEDHGNVLWGRAHSQ